jgi:hypothetical protein
LKTRKNKARVSTDRRLDKLFLFAYTKTVSLTTPKRCFGVAYRGILVGVLLLLANSPPLWASDEAKMVLALIDYIGGDYRNAVQGGKIINQDEYQEMTEFSTRSLELFERLKESEGRDRAGIEKDLRGRAIGQSPARQSTTKQQIGTGSSLPTRSLPSQVLPSLKPQGGL